MYEKLTDTHLFVNDALENVKCEKCKCDIKIGDKVFYIENVESYHNFGKNYANNTKFYCLFCAEKVILVKKQTMILHFKNIIDVESKKYYKLMRGMIGDKEKDFNKEIY